MIVTSFTFLCPSEVERDFPAPIQWPGLTGHALFASRDEWYAGVTARQRYTQSQTKGPSYTTSGEEIHGSWNSAWCQWRSGSCLICENWTPVPLTVNHVGFICEMKPSLKGEILEEEVDWMGASEVCTGENTDVKTLSYYQICFKQIHASFLQLVRLLHQNNNSSWKKTFQEHEILRCWLLWISMYFTAFIPIIWYVTYFTHTHTQVKTTFTFGNNFLKQFVYTYIF